MGTQTAIPERQRSARDLQTVVEPHAPPSKAGAFPNFTYHGGPVINCPQVYASYWGSAWSDAAHQARVQRLNQYHTDLLNSGFMNVLSQYGVGQGAGACGTFIRASFITNVPSTLTDSQIQGIIQSAITSGVLPEPPNPSNIALIIYLDETIGVDDPNHPGGSLVLCEPTNDNAFGYHSFFTTAAGNPFYYAIIPSLTDACLSESCPGGDGSCSLHLAESQEQRQTQVASHEFAEMTTDPQLNAWYDSGVSGENGDICNGESDTITVGSNTWTVQKTYSKYDDMSTNGAVHCLAQASSPEPALSPGPGNPNPPGPGGKSRTVASFNRMLPLPHIYFDAESKHVSMEDWHVHHYVKQLFHPFRPAHFLADLPNLLRQVADILEREKK